SQSSYWAVRCKTPGIERLKLRSVRCRRCGARGARNRRRSALRPADAPSPRSAGAPAWPARPVGRPVPPVAHWGEADGVVDLLVFAIGVEGGEGEAAVGAQLDRDVGPPGADGSDQARGDSTDATAGDTKQLLAEAGQTVST